MHQQHFNACPVTHEKIYTDLIFNSGLSTYTKGQFVRTYYDVAAGTGFYPASFLTQNNLRKRVAYTTYEPGSGLAPASTSYQSATFYDYDYHGNVKTILSQNKDIPATDPNNFMFNFSYQRVDYRYDLVSGKVLEVMLNKGREDQYWYRYGYDDQNRLRTAQSSAEGYWYDTDAEYIYYLHGPLARVEYGQNNVQGADYAYTIHGWLKSLNSEKLDPTLDPGKDGYTGIFANTARDAYGFALSYYQGDYTRIGTGGNNFLLAVPGAYYGNSNLYNGNIVAMNNTLKIWNSTATVEPVLQVFGYDQLNRIAESHAYKQNGAVSSIAAWNAGAPAGNLYRTGYTYDANGNIKNLQRYHATAQIDNLTYNYITNKNQLSSVSETIGASTVAYDIDNQAAGNYTYDNIGNLLSDASEQIQEIKWNVYGKVTEVIRSSGSARPNLKFSYDAAGRRITKAAIWSGSTTYTFYTLDAQGNTLAMYSKTSVNSDLVLEENLLYGSSRIGLHRRDKKLSFVAQTPTPVQVTRGKKRYELSDHLGNVHTVVSDRKKTECSGNTFTAYEPEIINMYDYYPFGMLMEERKGQKPECTTSSSATTKTPYNYGFSWLVDEGFAAVGTSVTLDQSTSALAVDRNSTTTATGWGASKGSHNLVKGVTYTLSYQLQGAAPSGYTTTVGRTVQVRLKWGASVMASGTLTLTSAMQSGSFNYTADYTGAYTIEIVYTGAAIAKGRFLADNVKITYNSQLTTVNCGVAEKYLFGHNGQMKDDEMYGVEGTSYTAEYWQYDSRLGRRWNLDPKPQIVMSDYACFANSPILIIDPKGDKIVNGFKESRDEAQAKVDEKKMKLDQFSSETEIKEYKKANREYNKAVKDFNAIDKKYQEVETTINDLSIYNNDLFNRLEDLTDPGGTTIDVYVYTVDNLWSDIFDNSLWSTENKIKLDGGTDAQPAGGSYSNASTGSEYSATTSNWHGNNTVTIVIDATVIDKGLVLAHEGGHAYYQVKYMLEYIQWLKQNPKTSPFGHGLGDPSGNEAKKEEDIYKTNKK